MSEKDGRTPAPLTLSREAVRLAAESAAALHRVLGQLLDGDVPPRGDTRKQLPADILAMLAPRVYLSTACEMAVACTMAVVRHPEKEEELEFWSKWLHQEQCRLNNKYSGKLCVCPCHERTVTS